jgi:hypothetical protein
VATMVVVEQVDRGAGDQIPPEHRHPGRRWGVTDRGAGGQVPHADGRRSKDSPGGRQKPWRLTARACLDLVRGRRAGRAHGTLSGWRRLPGRDAAVPASHSRPGGRPGQRTS